MTAPAAAALGQALALTLMTDTCVIYRLDYDHATPGAGGRDTYARTDLYTGRCRVRPASESRVGGSPRRAGDSDLSQSSYEVFVPLTVTELQANDLLTVTSSQDPRLVGRVYKMTGQIAGSQITARRMLCVEDSP